MVINSRFSHYILSLQGVFCGEDIPAKTLFGPLEGVMSSESAENKANIWQVTK